MILVLQKPERNVQSHGINIEETRGNGRPKAAPTISRIINQFKGSISKQIGYSIWQKLFHDRIIRNEDEHNRIVQYIESNPINWNDDCFHPANLEKNQ